jgi:hypothetical protein
MALQFTRNAKVYIELLNAAGGTRVALWQLGVLTGFSFSQSSNTSEVTVSEAGSTSRRASLMFNDSLAPVEWSFSTYARPVLDTVVRCPEEALWAMLMGADSYAAGVFTGDGSASPDEVNATAAGGNVFNFSQSNISSMSDKWQLWFAFEDGANKQHYKLPKAVVNSATIDFDIEGITTIQWSGNASQVVDAGSAETFSGALNGAYLTDTNNFIRNRLSTVSMVRTDTSPDDTYTVVLTGGSFTVENNISYLTPEELGKVNIPLANITGARKISGNLTCYLDNTAGRSATLLADLAADTTTVRNAFDLAINVGGDTGRRIVLDLPTATVQVPSIGVEDLITLDVGFSGQVAGGNIDATNEATITYRVT